MADLCLKRLIRWLARNDRNRWRIQPVNARGWLNIFTCVWRPSDFLGLWFNCFVNALSLAYR
jgi:hypothetical protein